MWHHKIGGYSQQFRGEGGFKGEGGGIAYKKSWIGLHRKSQAIAKSRRLIVVLFKSELGVKLRVKRNQNII